MPLTPEQLEEPVIISRGDLLSMFQNQHTIADALTRVSMIGRDTGDALRIAAAFDAEVDKLIQALKSNGATFHKILYGDNEGPN